MRRNLHTDAFFIIHVLSKHLCMEVCVNVCVCVTGIRNRCVLVLLFYHFVSVSISKLACSKISFLSENDDLTVSVNYSVFKMTVVT